MMHGVTEKTATSCLGKLFPFDLGSGAGDEVDTQEEKEDNGEIDKFESHVSLNSSTHENKASPNRETGYSDLFGTVSTINKTIDGVHQSREFMTMTNSHRQQERL